jgi:hypothetical protein
MGREESIVATCSRERMAHGDAASYELWVSSELAKIMISCILLVRKNVHQVPIT